MMTQSGLRFFETPWSLALSVGLVLVTASLCWIGWRRSGYAAEYGLVEVLRLLIAILVGVLLNQPEWVEEFRPKEKPTVAVLWDASKSMDTRDVAVAENSLDGPVAPSAASENNVAASGFQSRRESISRLTQSEFWKPLEERFRVVVEPFSLSPPGDSSDLYAPLATATERFSNLRSVVLASDGDFNEGLPPLQAAQGLRLANVPVMAVAVGSSTRLPDLELSSLDCPTVGVLGKPVRVPFTIRSSLPRECLATVTLRASDGSATDKEVLRKDVRIMPLGSATEWIYWTPRTVGNFTVTVDVPVQQGELLDDNNSRTAPISIREEKLRVLLVESKPRWEYRYLRNALSRDPGIELSCLLFQPGLSKVGGGNKDYIQKFPADLKELSEFDVVFLGDVGTVDGQLTPEDCRLLKGIVEFQASGLVFMPGFLGNQMSLVDTPLDELCPVVLDSLHPEGSSTSVVARMVLTEAGNRSLLTKLADSTAENIAVWEILPGFQWYAPVLKAKAGSEVLAVHQDAANQYGRIPLLVTRTFGAGKVLYMATDGAWRWRKGVEDKYHYRFWGQVVRWMAYRRNMAKGERMRLAFSPEQPQRGQSMALDAQVIQASGEPLQRGDVSLRIVAPSGAVETLRFAPPTDEGEWGVFSSSYLPNESGRHEATLSCKQTGDTLGTSFFVQGTPIEGIGRAARPEVLAEIAQVTRGSLVAQENIEMILKSLSALPEPPASVRRLQLWCHPIVVAVLVGLLGLFWTGRKRMGLV